MKKFFYLFFLLSLFVTQVYADKTDLPRGPLGKQQLSNCKIYRDENHKHEAQNPQIIDIASMNSKNKI